MSSIPTPSQTLPDLTDPDPQDFDYLREILTAPVYDVAVETPLQFGINLSQRYNRIAPGLKAAPGIKILYKREDLQPVFSFKIRGAYNKLRSLSNHQKERGSWPYLPGTMRKALVSLPSLGSPY
ncbi:hypothetical protein L0F63_002777 [Massospora cicadina]|nr:hypothetical protein L0F63_002777 [Massospora cicadina]